MYRPVSTVGRTAMDAGGPVSGVADLAGTAGPTDPVVVVARSTGMHRRSAGTAGASSPTSVAAPSGVGTLRRRRLVGGDVIVSGGPGTGRLEHHRTAGPPVVSP